MNNKAILFAGVSFLILAVFMGDGKPKSRKKSRGRAYGITKRALGVGGRASGRAARATGSGIKSVARRVGK